MCTESATRLIRPSPAYRLSHESFIAELRDRGEEPVPWVLHEVGDDFEAYVERLGNQSRGEDLPDGFVPSSTFWLVDGNDEIVAVSTLRHALTDDLRRHGGHIGYGVRPSARRRGYATEVLRLTLIEARKLGIDDVLITCEKDNVGSRNAILKNGGEFADEEYVEAQCATIQRYWIRASETSVPRECVMTIEKKAKEVVRRYVEAFNRGDLEGLRSLLAEDAEIQGVLGKGQFEKIAPIWRQLIDGYGMQLEIQDLVAEGPVVAARYRETGTFRAPAFGHEPTGSPMNWWRWSGSRSTTDASSAAGVRATRPPRPASWAYPWLREQDAMTTGSHLGHRLATPADAPAIIELMRVAILENMKPFLSPAEIEAAQETMGIDWTLIEDETYFLVEATDHDPAVLVGCGGWGKRKTLYGGVHTAGRDDRFSNPATDPARIRAMYTHPAWVRRGIGTLLLELGETAARDAGFRTIELGATIAGEPFYLARGYREIDRRTHIAANGAESVVIRMAKAL